MWFLLPCAAVLCICATQCEQISRWNSNCCRLTLLVEMVVTLVTTRNHCTVIICCCLATPTSVVLQWLAESATVHGTSDLSSFERLYTHSLLNDCVQSKLPLILHHQLHSCFAAALTLHSYNITQLVIVNCACAKLAQTRPAMYHIPPVLFGSTCLTRCNCQWSSPWNLLTKPTYSTLAWASLVWPDPIPHRGKGSGTWS